MKVLQEKYPMGTIPRQRSPGRYVDGTFYENLNILAEKIAEDMTFLALISSSTLEVGTGKSSFVQQVGEIWTDRVNEIHKQNLTFTMKNVVFNSDDLIDRAFKLPKYSCLILDEGDDMDTHYYSKISMTLRKFFRKCRQLNLFIIVILPNFFQIPASYAISRSVFFVDVKFFGKFERGYFDFYSFKKKKLLYLRGKKTQDYGVVRPDFSGRFLKGYAVPEKEYTEAKYLDMLRDNENDLTRITPAQEKRINVRIFNQLQEKSPELTMKTLAEVFNVTQRTLFRWKNEPPQSLTKTD